MIAVDMPGAGMSDCDSRLNASLASAAARLRRFLDVAGVDKCDLVGSSYGGATALTLAARHPARVRTLTLVSPANPWSRIGRKRLALLSLPWIARLFPPIARELRTLHRFSVRRMYGDPRRVTAETLSGYSKPLQRPGVFEHAVKIAQSWRSDMHDLENELGRVSEIPVLILWGSRDRLVDLASAKTLTGRLPKAEFRLLPGLGHLPYEEDPQGFAAVLLEFLARRSPVQGLDGK